MKNLNQNILISTIILKTIKGYHFLNLSQIVRLESHRNYVHVYRVNEKDPLKALCNLSVIEEKLRDTPHFLKCHRCHIVNIQHVERMQEKVPRFITSHGEVPIAESYIKDIKNKLCL